MLHIFINKKLVFRLIIYSFIIIFNSLVCNDLYAQIFINEVMPNNESCISDYDGEYSDWIELYNNSNDTINLNNYLLSDNRNNLSKWSFPQKTINPGGTILIFASGKNLIIDSELHANFKLSSDGEPIYLSNNSGIVIDSIRAITLSEDESYGRLPDGSYNLVHLDVCSPNNSNNNTTQLVFSKPAGFYQIPFYLNIKSLQNDTIYYSLDGSIPNMNSYILNDSIFIYNRSLDPNYFSAIPTCNNNYNLRTWIAPANLIDKANIIRCVSYRDGRPSSKIYTQSYFINPDTNHQYNTPVISLVTEEKNLFSNETGIYVPGVNFNETAGDPMWTGNFFQKGILWERPVHIEYFNESGLRDFFQDSGIRVHGGLSRSYPQKSLRLYARTDYGRSKFNYRLLPKTNNKNYNRFILRSSMSSWNNSMITDIIAHDIVDDLNIDNQDHQPVIVFFNGEYWGVHSIRDYINEDYLNYTHDIDNDSILLLEGVENIYNIFKDIFNTIDQNNLNYTEAYEYIEDQIDIDNFLDYQVSEMFLANSDWPANNMKLWKKNNTNGKWRFIFYDLDGGLGNAYKNSFIHCTNEDESITWPNSPQSTFLFRRLLELPMFKDNFIARAKELLNTTFLKDLTKEHVLNIADLYSSSNKVSSYIERWSWPNDYSTWLSSIDELVEFFQLRPCEFAYQLFEFMDSPLVSAKWARSFCEYNYSESTLIIFPNPNNGIFEIVNNFDEDMNGMLNILNLTGNIVYSEKDFYCEIIARKKINLPRLKNGIYLLSYIGENNTETIKFVIKNNMSK